MSPLFSFLAILSLLVINQALDLILEANDEEQASLENWAENLQGTERYERAEERASAIEEASSSLEELRDSLDDIINDNF